MSESDLAAVNWPEELTIYGPGPDLWPLKFWSQSFPKELLGRKIWPKFEMPYIWPITINGQSQFTPASSDTNILKS